MIQKGASMTQKGPVKTTSRRLAPLFALALLVAPTFLTAATATHAGELTVGIPAGQLIGMDNVTIPTDGTANPRDLLDPLRDETDTIPAVDQLRDRVLAEIDANLDLVEAELARRNLSSYGPATAARIYEDHVDAGTRIGGIGPWRTQTNDAATLGGWRIAPVGSDGSMAFTMTDPETGTYGTMDLFLVSPVIDLSAYPLNTGTLPNAPGLVFQLSEAYCAAVVGFTDLECEASSLDEVCDTAVLFSDRCPVPLSGVQDPLKHFIVLLFRHRYNLVDGEDGAQVALFDYDPLQGGKARVLTPMELLGSSPYSDAPVNGLDGGHGFTGDSGGWNQSAFDLTPWAGKQVWIGFRIGTGNRAGSDPDYFDPESGSFGGPAPYGWAIDDIEIHGPAYGQNLKVFSIDGPSFRYDSKDQLHRTVPGETTHVGATVLNAGANATLANLTLTVDGLDERVVRYFTKELQAGETWNVTIPVVAPVQEGQNFTVHALVQRPPSAGSVRMPDLTDDNELTRVFTSSTVRRHEISLSPGAPIVDDNVPQVATVTVRNTGNVPIDVSVDLFESYNATNASTGIRDIPTNVTHAQKNVTLAAGESEDVNWTVGTSARGPHVLVANASGPGLPVISRNATYHVHSSPPPAFAVGGGTPLGDGWDTYLSAGPVDAMDGWAWRAENATPGRTLRGLPVPEVSGTGEYEDLRLKVRYFSTAPIRVDITFANPASAPLSGESDYTNPHVWTHTLPAPGRNDRFPIHTNRSWATYEVDVQLEERNGSIDLWSVRGLEVHVRTLPNARPIYLDDLRLTGIPAGKDEAWRREIVRITGDPANAVTEVPAQPNSCAVSAAGVAANCWTQFNEEMMRASAANTLWSLAPQMTYDGKPVLALYSGELGQDFSDRIVSPVIQLDAASDPVIFLDHAYNFQGFPNDQMNGNRPELNIRQIGIVEVQYLQDDGTWSRFQQIKPVGGHRAVLEFTDDGRRRDTKSAYGIWDDGAGFFQPSACHPNYDTGDFCNGGGFFRNLNGTQYRWRQFPPTPYWEVSVFRLRDQLPGVDLTTRPIRIALHTTENEGNAEAVEPTRWRMLGLRVTPVSRFAIDGAASNLTLLADYDWQRLGVAPGVPMPVNVTVTNEGLFREEFQVRLGHAQLGGQFRWEGYVTVGPLLPGEATNVTLLWNVTDAPGRRHYNLTAEVSPLSNRTFDENVFNDKTHLGQDQSLFSEKVRDAGLALQGFPLRGDKGVLRYLPVTVHNLGNVAIPNLTIERTIEYLHPSGARTVPNGSATFNFTRAFAPTREPIALSLAAPGVRESQLTFTPEEYGTYLVTLRLKGDGARFLDSTAADNEARIFLEAVEPIVADDFEERIRWYTDQPDVWGEGPGFRSQSSLTAANRTNGLLPANLDASVVSPKLNLANARTAVVNFVARYDLEEGYDGVVVEVSNDNRTWRRAGLLDELGRAGPLPGKLTASNPIVGDPAADNATAFTGSSAALPSNLEGWAPFSIDLSTIPGVGESVVFDDLAPPFNNSLPLATQKAIQHAPWMVLDPADAENMRWEIRNLQHTLNEREWRFWSNMSKVQGTVTLAREWNLRAEGVSPASLIVVTWLDRRPGTQGSSWEGVGADYFFKANNLTYKPEVVGRTDGGWYRLRAVLPENTSREEFLRLRFDMRSGPIFSASSYGWEVRGITVDSVPALNGQPLPGAAPLKTLTGDENATGAPDLWLKSPQSVGWSWVNMRHPEPAAPWSGVQGPGPDGRPRDLWKLTLNDTTRINVDTRLVSPVVDLGQVGGGETFLRVVHKYDLRHEELVMNRGTRLTDNKYYQAGVVEIEVWNRTTISWDTPRQLWAEGTGPTRETIRRDVDYPVEGAPYTRTLADAGDTFERFPRRADQPVGASVTYIREFDFNTSYAFSGLSTDVPGNADGWITSEFDLSPYRGERVRVVFHAWSGPNDAAGKVRHWTIADADVVGNIMSAKDVYLRFRLGTDASLLPGSFSVDQFEVSGRRYESSIGVQVDERPATVGVLANGTVRARLQNHGQGVRENVALGVQIVPLAGTHPTLLPTVVGTGGTPRLALTPTGYAAAFGPFRLASAGLEESIRNVTFRIDANNTAGNYTVRLVLLEAGGGAFAFAPAKDEVPGRAGREWSLSVEDTWRAALDKPVASPGARSDPGPVVASVVATNVGTRDVNVSAVFTWSWNDNGTPAARSVVPAAGSPLVAIKPRAAHAFTAPAVTLGPGNYTLRVELLNGTSPFSPPVESLLRYRVERSDLIYQTSFENGLEGWSFAGPTPSIVQVTRESAAFGERSVNFGIPQWLYEFGVTLEEWYGVNFYAGNLTSPVIDARGALPDASLTFWKKSSLRTFNVLYPEVRILAKRVNAEGGTDTACPAAMVLTPEPAQRLSERDADWSYVRVPLRTANAACPLVGARFTVSFMFIFPLEKGWMMDGVTVWSGLPHVQPSVREHLLSDGARKDYLFQVENRGASVRDFVPELARNQSRLTPEQVAWVKVSPERLVLAPGQRGVVTVSLDPPSSRSLFEQPLNVTVALRDATMPYVFNVTQVDLDFQPRDRADLAALASMDGAPLTQERLRVEEGTPHEVGVLVSNLGLTPSKATDVLLRVLNATGGVEWEHRERIDPLAPVNDGGEAALVTAVWKPTYGRRGNATLQVSVDPDRQQVDYDRANSDLSLPLAITPLIRPDLVVDPRAMRLATPSGLRIHEAEPGQLVRISGLVRNDGLADAKQVVVRIVAGSSVLKEEILPTLKVGESYVVATNQIAPANSTTYQILALTPDLEILADNNAQSLELPILPPELLIGLAEPEIRLEPGLKRTVALNVTNTAPYPTTVNVSLGAGARFATLGTTRLALGPGETRGFTLSLAPGEREVAGEQLLPVILVSSEGLRIKRTLTLDVEARPAASAIPYLARGPPQDVRVEMDVVNDGNVELRPVAVVRDAAGAILGRHDLPAVPPGKSRFAAVSLDLPDATPPGVLDATLAIEAGGKTLAQTPMPVEVKPWGRLLARAQPGELKDGRQDVAITVTYEGNAPTVRTPVVFNAPEGVVARYSEESLALAPGDSRSLTLRISAPSRAPNGLYLLQAGFLDPEEGTATMLANLTSIPLDLRRGKTELADATRLTAEAVGGSRVEYLAKVRNGGDLDAKNVVVDLYVDGALVDRQVLETLAAGQSSEVRLGYVAESGRHAVVLAVNPHAPEAERPAAFAETLEVAKGAVEGVAGLSPVPAPGVTLLLAALGVAVLAFRRRVRAQ